MLWRVRNRAGSRMGRDSQEFAGKKRRRKYGNHHHGSDRDSHLDGNFKNCRVSVVPHAPTRKTVGAERGKQILKGASSGSQKRSLPDGLHAKPVDRPSCFINEPLASNSAQSTEQCDSDRKRDASPERHVPESRLLPVGDHQDDCDQQSQARADQTAARACQKQRKETRECPPGSSEDFECEMLIRPIQQQKPDRRKSERLL